MRRAVFSLLFLAPFASAANIPSGTHVLLRMMNSVSTRTATEGTQVYLQTVNPIAVDGQILVPVGSYVQGVVSHSKRSGRVAGRAEIGIRLETLTLPGGKALKFSPKLSAVDSAESDQKVQTEEDTVKQGSDVGRDAKRIAIIAGTGAGIGGLTDRSWEGAGIGAGAGSVVGFAAALLMRGREVELRQGSTLDVVFDRPVAVE
jgi:hypothetical protein